MSLRKRDNHMIKIALDSRAARFNMKKKEFISNRRKSMNYKINVKKLTKKNQKAGKTKKKK